MVSWLASLIQTDRVFSLRFWKPVITIRKNVVSAFSSLHSSTYSPTCLSPSPSVFLSFVFSIMHREKLHNSSFPESPEFHYELLTHADKAVRQQIDRQTVHSLVGASFFQNEQTDTAQAAGHSLVGDSLLL